MVCDVTESVKCPGSGLCDVTERVSCPGWDLCDGTERVSAVVFHSAAGGADEGPL